MDFPALEPTLNRMAETFKLLGEWSHGYGWFLAVLGLAYLVASFTYWKRARRSDERIYLAPVSVEGGVAEKLGSREAGLLLLAQLESIVRTFQKDRSTQATLATAEAVGDAFRTVHTALASTPLDLGESEIHLKDELVIDAGPLRIPVGALWNLFRSLVQLLPAFRRRAYLSSIIHVSLISSGDETLLLVRRGPRTGLAATNGQVGQGATTQAAKDPVRVLVGTQTVKSLGDMSRLLRKAAFDVLHLHGRAFPHRHGESMMHFADGLDYMDEYRRRGDPQALAEAEERFSLAVTADPDHHEALYFLGSLLLLKRNKESILQASRLFLRALDCAPGKLRALAHASLAACYGQQIHRLAMRGETVQEKANRHIETAEEEWFKVAKGEPLHLWILLVKAMVSHVDEGTEATRTEAKRRFVHAISLYLEGLERSPDSATLHNNLGWALLKLAEWGVERVEEIDGAPEQLVGDPAEAAERHFLQSLELNPLNKLCCANLCLLYATPRYRQDGAGHLVKSRFYGQAAVLIDPEYINGYRDLAHSLIRYGELDEAYEHFERALQLADNIAKDIEIIEDTLKVLAEVGMTAEDPSWKDWAEPDRQLLQPVEKAVGRTPLEDDSAGNRQESD